METKTNNLAIYPAALILGISTGIACSLFLWLLDLATKTRIHHGQLHWLLPLAGVVVTLVYQKWGQGSVRGNNLILDEIHDPKVKIPFAMAPLIVFGTVWTHLFGGSAGREGSAVQMGGAISERVAKLFKLSPAARRSMLIAGLGAGFGAAISAPLAGVIFGHEVLHERGLIKGNFLPTAIASFSAYAITHLLGAPHTLYPILPAIELNFTYAGLALVSAFIFALTAFIFCWAHHLIESRYQAIKLGRYLKIFIAGFILALLFEFAPPQYQGLGLETIVRSLENPMGAQVFLIKMALTVLTLAVGFKGGEFTPLVFIGATLGSALALKFGVPITFLSTLGFAAVFAAAARTPLACSIMLVELFHWSYLPYALICCFGASFLAHKLASKLKHRPRLYQSQREFR